MNYLLAVSGRDLLTELGEVRAHVALEVEVGELITRTELEERGKGGVGVDLATVRLVLEGVGADVLVDLAGDLSAGHLGTRGLAKESGELITDESGLHETTWGAVSDLALAALNSLLSSLELTGPLLLEGAEVSAERRELRGELVELAKELSELILETAGNRSGLSGNWGNNLLGYGSRSGWGSSLGGRSGTGLAGLLGASGGGRGSGLRRSSLNGSCFTRHIIHYYGSHSLNQFYVYNYYLGMR